MDVDDVNEPSVDSSELRLRLGPFGYRAPGAYDPRRVAWFRRTGAGLGHGRSSY